ncbi:MAG: hypothetical protein C7B46_08370 [Sulfobacillus benefaciens]|uniref:P-type ATPase A domain-containing protein n=1 Tax=Sulfobacillus benefaciens TaxID=453960 RepID=A0A2T2XH96_9FIRM|nr:MAG: hypothetical protein C7B46_08370 [Sulfobacillus benefaciens]
MRPGQQIPIDGLIAEGSASIKETFLTGEAVPVDKTTGDPVYAGTTNVTGRLLIQTTRVYRESLLA